MAEKTLIDLGAVKQRQRHYETVFIVSPAVPDADVKAIAEKAARVTSEAGATILRQDDWGKKRMAYPIDRHAMGRYFYFRFIGTNVSLKALERMLKLDAQVLRYQSISLSEALSADQIRDLVERAPKEPSAAPTIRNEEDEPQFESALS